jgi:hypothetical protein
MALFRRNLAKKRKFIPSAVVFGFCMARVVTMSLHIAWACHPTIISLGIASQILVYAGIFLLFIVNLELTNRVLRYVRPRLGGSTLVSVVFKALYILIGLTIAMVITVTVQMFYTLDSHTLHIDRAIQRYAVTFFAVIAFLPMPVNLLILALNAGNPRVENSALRVKVAIVCAIAVLLCFGAGYRAGTVWNPQPFNDPAWFDSRAAFYVFNFALEVVAVYLLLLCRVDRKFYIPNSLV